MNFQAVCTTVGVWTKKHMPDILMGLGLTGIVTGTVMACKKSMEVEPIFEKHNHDLKMAKTFKKDNVKKVYVSTGIKLVKHYAWPAVIYIGGIACTLTSHVQLNKRNASLSAAYVTLLTSFEGYRAKVVDKYGKEVDEEFNLGLKKVKSKKKGETYKEVDAPLNGKLSYLFSDATSEHYEVIDNSLCDYNFNYLKNIQNWADDHLKASGYLFLYDVLKTLGMTKFLTKDEIEFSKKAGWMYAKDPEKQVGPDYVDFGMYDVQKPQVVEFLRGEEKAIYLNFNAVPNLTDLDYII